ncbi:MAG: FAD-dependent oxidoreductase [Armatimonadetes bacterium]|nr:FAD-dependent oxidoreductase [Armatimonadota bacterium]
MKNSLKWSKEVKVKEKVDVLVVGGGVAGVAAAISSARNGMNTLLIEGQFALGGLVTLGYVCYLAGYPEGIGNELLERLTEVGAVSPQRRIADPEKTKHILEEMVMESGARILYGTMAIDSIVEGGVIKGVIVHNKSGIQAILAERVVDCSGDGDVAAYAGAPFEVGWDEKGGYNQAVSLDFVLANVDWHKFQSSVKRWYNYLQEIAFKAVEKGVLSKLVETGYLGPLPGRQPEGCEVYVCSAHSRNCRTTDAEDLTRIAIEQRRQMREIVEFYRKYVPGFENCRLVYSAPMLGIRDSRRIIGEYVLTAEDIVLARKFEDAIARDTHGFDIHNPTDLPHIKHTHLKEPKEPAVCFPSEEKAGMYDAYLRPGEYYEIPYRCLVPLNVENLLVAGRCLSSTFEAQSGARLIFTCMTMGQAAGTAAAISIRKNVTPRQVDVQALRAKLIEQGVRLDIEPPIYVKGGPHQPIPKDAKFAIEKAGGIGDEIVVIMG